MRKGYTKIPNVVITGYGEDQIWMSNKLLAGVRYGDGFSNVSGVMVGTGEVLATLPYLSKRFGRSEGAWRHLIDKMISDGILVKVEQDEIRRRGLPYSCRKNGRVYRVATEEEAEAATERATVKPQAQTVDGNSLTAPEVKPNCLQATVSDSDNGNTRRRKDTEEGKKKKKAGSGRGSWKSLADEGAGAPTEVLKGITCQRHRDELIGLVRFFSRGVLSYAVLGILGRGPDVGAQEPANSDLRTGLLIAELVKAGEGMSQDDGLTPGGALGEWLIQRKARYPKAGKINASIIPSLKTMVAALGDPDDLEWIRNDLPGTDWMKVKREYLPSAKRGPGVPSGGRHGQRSTRVEVMDSRSGEKFNGAEWVMEPGDELPKLSTVAGDDKYVFLWRFKGACMTQASDRQAARAIVDNRESLETAGCIIGDAMIAEIRGMIP